MTVERELEGGAYEVVELPLPAVVAVQTGVAVVEPRILRVEHLTIERAGAQIRPPNAPGKVPRRIR